MKSAEVAYLGNRASQEINLGRLIETRVLIQSNSGGGKSWAIRRILEQTAGMVQQIILDPEGEYATLREKHDMIICAPHDADVVASPKTAPLLARKLLETGVNAAKVINKQAAERPGVEGTESSPGLRAGVRVTGPAKHEVSTAR